MTKMAKSWFDLSTKEKRKMLLKIVEESTASQWDLCVEIGYIEALNDAIEIVRKVSKDEPMTKNPVILELQVLKQLRKRLN